MSLPFIRWRYVRILKDYESFCILCPGRVIFCWIIAYLKGGKCLRTYIQNYIHSLRRVVKWILFHKRHVFGYLKNHRNMSKGATKNNQTSDDNYDGFQHSYSKPYSGELSWMRGEQKGPLPKICHTYPTMMKLGTVIPYLKKIQKIDK